MIKLFAMDVDGTLTDGKINLSENGELFKSFNVKDGLGIKLLIENNILPVIITGRNSKIVLKRVQELGITYVYQNINNKKECLKELCDELKISFDDCAYIGDDVNDLEVLKSVRYSYAPSDSVKAVLENAEYICSSKGGEGAVREAIENVLTINN